MNHFNRNSKNRGKRRDFDKRGSFGAGRDRERPEMHEATCSACGKRCEVPFRPTGQKPVYCNDCFRGDERRGGGFEKPSYKRDSFRDKREGGFGKEEFNKLICRLDTIIDILMDKEGTRKNSKEAKKKHFEKDKEKKSENK